MDATDDDATTIVVVEITSITLESALEQVAVRGRDVIRPILDGLAEHCTRPLIDADAPVFVLTLGVVEALLVCAADDPDVDAAVWVAELWSSLPELDGDDDG